MSAGGGDRKASRGDKEGVNEVEKVDVGMGRRGEGAMGVGGGV